MKTADLKAIMALFTRMRKGVGKHASRPILDQIEVSSAHLRYSNLDSSLQFEQALPYIGDEDILAPLAQIATYAKKTKNGSIDLKRGETDFQLVAGKSKVSLPSFSAERYPEHPTVSKGEADWEVSAQDLLTIIERTAPFMDTEKNRFSLNSMFFAGDYAVATNQVVLRATRLNKEFINIPFRFVLSANQISTLKGLCKLDKEDTFSFYADEKRVTIKGKGWEYTCLQVEIQYSNYLAAIDNVKGRCGFVKHTKEEWLSVVGEVDTILTDEHKNAAVTASSIKACTPLGKIEVDFEAGVEGELPTGINPALLMDYIKTLDKGETTDSSFAGPRKPVVFRDKMGFFFVSPVAV